MRYRFGAILTGSMKEIWGSIYFPSICGTVTNFNITGMVIRQNNAYIFGSASGWESLTDDDTVSWVQNELSLLFDIALSTGLSTATNNDTIAVMMKYDISFK